MLQPIHAHCILITTYKKDAKEIGHYGWVLSVTESFKIADNDFSAKKSSHCNRVLVLTELVIDST